MTICSNLFFHIFCCQLDPLTATGFYLTINVVFTPYLWSPSKRRFRYHPLIGYISLQEVASSNRSSFIVIFKCFWWCWNEEHTLSKWHWLCWEAMLQHEFNIHSHFWTLTSPIIVLEFPWKMENSFHPSIVSFHQLSPLNDSISILFQEWFYELLGGIALSSVSSTMNNEILNKKNTDGIPQQQDQLETTIFSPAPSHPLLWFTFLAVLANHMEDVYLLCLSCQTNHLWSLWWL